MSTVVVELPDQHIQKLEQIAQARGSSIEQIVAELVSGILTEESPDPDYDVTQDSLYTIQAHDSTAPADLAQNVDTYLYGVES